MFLDGLSKLCDHFFLKKKYFVKLVPNAEMLQGLKLQRLKNYFGGKLYSFLIWNYNWINIFLGVNLLFFAIYRVYLYGVRVGGEGEGDGSQWDTGCTRLSRVHLS